MKFTTPIHIVAAKRSPIGKFGGALKPLSAVDLATQTGQAALTENQLPIDNVVFGQVLQAGVGMNLARQVALRLELGHEVPGYTVNMVCGSGLKAIALAASAIEQGESQVTMAGGAESMSQAPYLLKDARWGSKLGNREMADAILHDGLTDPLLHIHMGETAERLAERYSISRAEQDEFALRSQQQAVANSETFEREIVPIQVGKELITHDEQPRPDTTIGKLAGLKPAFRKNGTVTAGNASTLNDGAAVVLLANERVTSKQNLTPRARLVGYSAAGCEPAMMGIGPVNAIRKLIAEVGWNLSKVDAVEINEAFAVQTLACARELSLRDEQLNIRGGAIALGHPIGCSGARVLVTLLHILEDHNLHRGIASLCIGGGMGIAMAIER